MAMRQTTGPGDDEDGLQRALLRAQRGEHDSGLTRSAAAMYFFQRGMTGAETLEVYRICSPFDHEDPLPALRHLGLAGVIEKIQSNEQR